MADDELSRSSAGDDDFEEADDDNGIDNEDEEEALEDADYEDELRGLEEDGELSIEELRRKYGLPVEGAATVGTSYEEEGSQGEGSGLQDSYTLFSNEEDDVEDDKDYAPPDPYRKEIRIGEEEYQATIPNLGDTEEPHPVSESLWTPTETLSGDQLSSYLKSIVEIRKSIGQTVDERYGESRDDEDSLCALLRANYDIEAAKASFPFPQVNKAIRSVRAGALDWDDEEKAHFEKALATHGKNFHVIKANSPLYYRSIGELVEYYYSWKKTDRCKAFRKRQLQPDEDYRQFATAILSDGISQDQKRPASWLEVDVQRPV